MELERALNARGRIAAFLNIDGRRRRAPGAPRVALGIAPGENGSFKVAIRAPSRTDLERALGEGVLDEVKDMADQMVDIRVTGELFAEPAPAANRNVASLGIGSSVGHYRCTAGTLGFFAQRLADSAVGFVSNNHVIAHCDRGLDGDDVLHPGPTDGGDRTHDALAELVGGYPRLQQNGAIVDAAFARFRGDVDYDVSNVGSSLKLNPTLVPLFRQRQVLKVGRSTGVTHGTITAFALQNLDVDYPALDKRITFDRQIEIKCDASDEAFSKPGDSGALVVNPDGHPVGLLFAGTRDGAYAYANPIADVLRELDIRFLT